MERDSLVECMQTLREEPGFANLKPELTSPCYDDMLVHRAIVCTQSKYLAREVKKMVDEDDPTAMVDLFVLECDEWYKKIGSLETDAGSHLFVAALDFMYAKPDYAVPHELYQNGRTLRWYIELLIAARVLELDLMEKDLKARIESLDDAILEQEDFASFINELYDDHTLFPASWRNWVIRAAIKHAPKIFSSDLLTSGAAEEVPFSDDFFKSYVAVHCGEAWSKTSTESRATKRRRVMKTECPEDGDEDDEEEV